MSMRVAVTGSTGLIGEALVASLRGDGHTVHRLVRGAASAPDEVRWDPMGGEVDTASLEGVDAVVHLAGEPIGSARWTDDTKRRIHESRSIGTDTLAQALAAMERPPSVLVSSSGVGVYGADRGAEVLDETSSVGGDFLADVCVDWEAATQPAADAGIRVVNARTGVVIAEGGPLLDKIELPFKLGVGGKVLPGTQYVAWISLADQIGALRFCIDHEVRGPVNLTAPTPVTNAELTKDLGAVMRRPTVLPIPAFAIRALYGEMGVTLALSSQRALPSVLLDAGYTFTHTELREALKVALA